MAIFRSNANYGALDPETTNVIYVHGSIDPWHALGLVKSVNDRMPAIYIEGKFFEFFKSDVSVIQFITSR